MTDMIENMARAIADSVGPSFDMLHKNKRDWVETRGMFRGEPRDCNGPFQDDCIEAAKAALTALEQPSAEMGKRAVIALFKEHGHVSGPMLAKYYSAMIKAARGDQ